MSGWRAERTWGGEWCAAKTVRAGAYGTTGKVRVRRLLGIPAEWCRAEAQAHINALVRKGELT